MNLTEHLERVRRVAADLYRDAEEAVADAERASSGRDACSLLGYAGRMKLLASELLRLAGELERRARS